MTPKVIAFDLFGTVFDLAGVPREEIRAYIDHIEKPEWSPLTLPASWEQLPPHPDAMEGLRRISGKYVVATCSNAPLGFTDRLLRSLPGTFDVVVPLEANRVFKPAAEAYLTVCQVVGVAPPRVLMVTANPTLGRRDFGDVEAAREIGMQSVLIRGDSDIPTITALADRLGCP